LLTGKKFALARPTLALEAIEGQRRAVTIPAGAVVRVLSGPSSKDDTSTVSIEWDGRTLAMFAIDLHLRGTEVTGKVAGA